MDEYLPILISLMKTSIWNVSLFGNILDKAAADSTIN